MDEINNAVVNICDILLSGNKCHLKYSDSVVVRIIELRVKDILCGVRFVFVERGGYWLVIKE